VCRVHPQFTRPEGGASFGTVSFSGKQRCFENVSLGGGGGTWDRDGNFHGPVVGGKKKRGGKGGKGQKTGGGPRDELDGGQPGFHKPAFGFNFFSGTGLRVRQRGAGGEIAQDRGLLEGACFPRLAGSFGGFLSPGN